jgi:WS/DGAT/MGAT family acyltransferase
LAGGRIAYYNRVHHACLDGVSGQAAVQAVLDAAPEPVNVAPPDASHSARPAREPFTDLLVGAFENLARFQIRQASRVFDHVDTGMRLLQRSIDPGKGLGAVAELAPPTRFNRAVYQARSYATGELSLRETRAIGKVTGATLNDVFLGVCSGALRRYLGRLGELPERSLVAGCPVSLRRPGDKSLNNQVTMMQVSFATDEADPVKRLLRIARSSIQAKGVVAAISGSYDADVALPGLPTLVRAAAQFNERFNLADTPIAGVPFNMVVSNVPGPRQPLHSLGGRVLTHYPVSIPAHGQAMNVTVQSYVDHLFFGITGCARALPDPQVFRDDMLDAYAELVHAVLGVDMPLAPVIEALPLVGRRRERAGVRVGERAPAPAAAAA